MTITHLEIEVSHSVEIADITALLTDVGMPAQVSAESADMLDTESVRALASAARA